MGNLKLCKDCKHLAGEWGGYGVCLKYSEQHISPVHGKLIFTQFASATFSRLHGKCGTTAAGFEQKITLLGKLKNLLSRN